MIAVLSALKEEVSDLKKGLTPVNPSAQDGAFLAGRCAGKDILLVLTGIGRDKAEKALRLALEKYSIGIIISTGCAGALNDRSRNGDILIYRELTGAAGLEAATEAQPLLQPDEHLLDQALQCAQAKDCRCFTGRGLTVPEVINTPAGKQALGNRYQADTVDMESYWLAAMARSHKVPFIALRSIFDAVTDNLATLSSFFNQGKISYSALCAGLLAHPSQIGELLSFRRNADLAQRNLSGYLRQLFEYLQE